MLASDLETKLVQTKCDGCRPFLVVATAGTTVLGAFDDIDDIADVCERHSVWLHVDVRTHSLSNVASTYKLPVNNSALIPSLHVGQLVYVSLK